MFAENVGYKAHSFKFMEDLLASLTYEEFASIGPKQDYGTLRRWQNKRVPPRNKLGDWHDIFPGLKYVFTPVHRTSQGHSLEWLVAHFTTMVAWHVVSYHHGFVQSLILSQLQKHEFSE